MALPWSSGLEGSCEMGEREEHGIEIEGGERKTLKEPLLLQKNPSRINTTSQIAIVGANVCPIESLDYEWVLSSPSPFYDSRLRLINDGSLLGFDGKSVMFI